MAVFCVIEIVILHDNTLLNIFFTIIALDVNPDCIVIYFFILSHLPAFSDIQTIIQNGFPKIGGKMFIEKLVYD